MGHNLTWVCHTHKKHHTSMRGEEGIDFQAMIRLEDCPGPCLNNQGLTVYGDQCAPGHIYEYDEVWPNWSDRPANRDKDNI